MSSVFWIDREEDLTNTNYIRYAQITQVHRGSFGKTNRREVKKKWRRLTKNNNMQNKKLREIEER